MRHLRRGSLCLAGLVLSLLTSARAAETAPKSLKSTDARPTLTIPRVNRPPTLEAFLSMKADWETGLHMAKVGGFVQRNPSGDTSILRPQRRYINDAHQFFMKFSYLWRF